MRDKSEDKDKKKKNQRVKKAPLSDLPAGKKGKEVKGGRENFNPQPDPPGD